LLPLLLWRRGLGGGGHFTSSICGSVRGKRRRLADELGASEVRNKLVHRKEDL
jgi:hypothetical protein